MVESNSEVLCLQASWLERFCQQSYSWGMIVVHDDAFRFKVFANGMWLCMDEKAMPVEVIYAVFVHDQTQNCKMVFLSKQKLWLDVKIKKRGS